MGELFPMKPHEVFRHVAHKASDTLGTPMSFVLAVTTIGLWAMSGPYFHYSDTWQLVINTSTTIITFLMVFLIQASQNRDSRAIHLKLDELIRTSRARNAFADLENATDRELDTFAAEFKTLRQSGLDPFDAAEGARTRVRHKHKR